MYEEMLGLWTTTGRSIDTSFWRHVAIVLRDTAKDWRFILRDPDYSPLTKVKWFVQAPAYNVARRVAVRLARRPELPGWAAWAMGRPRPITVADGVTPAART
jgi:hypothetical protein